MNKIKKIFYFMSSKNLIGEIKNYGYSLSIRQLILSYLGTVLTGLIAGYLFKVPIVGYIAIGLTGIMLTPYIIKISFKSLYEQRRFSDISQYLEKILYGFKSSKKVINTLEGAADTFKDGEMKNVIEQAIHYIYTSEDFQAEKNALKIIEESYPSRKIKNLHKFILTVESEGGDPELGVDMLLKDRQMWTDRIISIQPNLKVTKLCVILSLFLTLALCLGMMYINNLSGISFLDISGNIYAQYSAIVLIIILLFFYYMINKKVCIDWVNDKGLTDEEYEKKYNYVINYDRKKELTKSLIYSLIPAVLTAVLYTVTQSTILLICGALIFIFVLFSYSIGYSLAYKELSKDLSNSFSEWLIQVALLMQFDSVQMSILKSYDDAPGILKPAIKNMLLELDENPNSAEPYKNFLSDFNITEAQEGMSALYSISNAIGGDIQEEFKTIITRTNNLIDRSERLRLENKVELLNLYIVYPTLVGAGKLMVDMVVMMLTCMASMGSFI